MWQGSDIFYVCFHVASVCVSGRSVFWSVRGALCASESPCCIVTEKHDLVFCSAVQFPQSCWQSSATAREYNVVLSA